MVKDSAMDEMGQDSGPSNLTVLWLFHGYIYKKKKKKMDFELEPSSYNS